MGILRDITDYSTLIKKSNEISYKDSLTGLYNRRYYEVRFDFLLESNKKISFILMDLDDFKFMNDNFGHLEEDRVLKIIARHISNSIRNNDLTFRIGGDEFLVTLPNSSINIATKVAYRIQKNLANEFKSEKFISFSAGVHQKSYLAKSKEDIFEKSGCKLYEAKKLGKGLIKY